MRGFLRQNTGTISLLMAYVDDTNISFQEGVFRGPDEEGYQFFIETETQETGS